MGKLKKLQDKYLKGEITKAVYNTEVKKLLDEEFLDQEQYDLALEYDPEEDKPKFTQSDVDHMVAVKAVKMVRKALKDAGVEVDADNKTLLAKVAEMAKGGTDSKEKGKDNGDGKNPDAEELTKLRKQVGKFDSLTAKIKDLTVENAVLKASGKYNPINPSQVVRALMSDYMDLVGIDDETGLVDAKALDRAIRKVAESEPNLFKASEGGEGDNGGQGTNNGQGNNFRGKGPGGGTGGDTKTAEFDKKKAQALEMLGIKKPETK